MEDLDRQRQVKQQAKIIQVQATKTVAKTKKTANTDVSRPAKKQKKTESASADDLPSLMEIDNTQAAPSQDVGASQMEENSSGERDGTDEEGSGDEAENEDGDSDSDYNLSSGKV